jgi:hypothetical protein
MSTLRTVANCRTTKPKQVNEMPALVTSAAIETCLRTCLSREGYELSPTRRHGETGVDIEARQGPVFIAIEVIGFKSSPPARAKDFYESFFRAVSRLNGNATRCAIAMPSRFSQGLPARANQHRVAWLRIAQAFPELEIWLVDLESQSYRASKWGDWIATEGSFSATAR